MLMLMNAWMMLVLMKCKFKMQCLTLGCYRNKEEELSAMPLEDKNNQGGT